MAVLSLVTYPTLQLSILPFNEALSTVAPQFVAHLENFIISFTCFVMAYRFRQMLASMPIQSHGLSRIRHYYRLNILLGLVTLMDGFFLFIINVDAMNVVINKEPSAFNKFWLDVFTRLFNFGFTTAYPIAFSLLYPTDAGTGGTQNNPTASNRPMTMESA